MSRRLTALALTCAALALPPSAASASPPVATSAACQSVSYGGRSYVLYRQGVKCSYARRWVKRLHRTKRGPKRWDCSSGSNFRTGGYCERGSRHFGWHPGD